MENKRLKVVILEYFLPGSTYSLELCNKLGEKCDLTLICKDNFIPKGKASFDIKNVLHSSSNNAVSSLTRYLNDLKKISSVVKQIRPDIFHLEGVVHSEFEKVLIKRLKPYVGKIVFTAHNILSHEAKKKEKEKLNNWYKLFDGIIVHNNGSKQMLSENSDYSSPICVMPHGAYGEYAGKAVHTESTSDKFTFLQFGLIREYKGVDILLNSVAKLSPEVRKKVKIIIAGKQNKQQYLYDIEKEVENLQLSDCVELLIRRIEEEEIPDLFNNADCCLFPYKNIYGSGALLMAYTFGKPVIASDIPVFVEETDNGSTGLLFKSEDTQALANAITDFVMTTDAQRAEMINKVVFLRDNKYSWENSARTSLDFYLKLLNDR